MKYSSIQSRSFHFQISTDTEVTRLKTSSLCGLICPKRKNQDLDQPVPSVPLTSSHDPVTLFGSISGTFSVSERLVQSPSAYWSRNQRKGLTSKRPLLEEVGSCTGNKAGLVVGGWERGIWEGRARAPHPEAASHTRKLLHYKPDQTQFQL